MTTQQADMDSLQYRVRRRVAQDLYKQLYEDHKTKVEEPGKDAKDSKPKTLWDRLTISNILWLTAACVLFYSSDIVRVGFYDDRVKRTWFNIGAVFICVNVCIASFLVVYLTFIKKIKTDDWEIYYPSAIPIATVCFIFGASCMLVALWPIYNYFTPVLLFTLLMGFVVIVSWLP